jgi:hypothetical protein
MTLSVPNTGNDIETMPPHLFSSEGICERALRKVGAFSINDEAPRDEELTESLFWLDMIVAELSATQDCFWLRPATITADLILNQADYILAEFDGMPPEGVVFIMRAWVRDPYGDDQAIDIWRKTKYEDQQNKATSGTPEAIFVNRLVQEPTLFTYPVIGLAGYSLRLDVQTFNPRTLTTQADSEIPKGTGAHHLGAEWQRFLVYALSAEIGDGPVRKLEKGTIDGWRQVAGASKAALNSYVNREKRRAGRTKRWGG